ncbi:Concanavalin A-like protein lectin/glucanase, subgroup [Cinnamomum micranthum f. kanehirae]|uniref:Concanavalin A-like protein lectin/glucanase, subgroup n=1 Tax=Cinnamomum micranthum f. kanehirae TaxID=337451 RepID=A0A443Q151_9MAGN|nr:Concanavalin A-like protein lectin/glucanase, subgroup [Cinnamomum micranthum f. kanehirae]
MYAKDSSLVGRLCDGEIVKFLKAAFACVVSCPENRPTMLEVYQLLRAIGARYGFICKFNGIECWQPDESKVLNLRLSNMGLRGQFPSSLKNYTSMTGLDLSNNGLSGSLPPNIDEIIPYFVKLDLSSNKFSGNLPASLCKITINPNVLNLQHNQFSGDIPCQFRNPTRLTTFDASNNPLWLCLNLP